MNKYNKGFTLIELLVVIAIIGILSSVVISSLGKARDKAGDASVRAGLNQALTQADMYYNINSSYTDICSIQSDTIDPKGINKMVQVSGQANGFKDSITVNGAGTSSVRCNDSNEAWATEIPLKNETGYYCVDSTKKGIVTEISISSSGNYTYCR